MTLFNYKQVKKLADLYKAGFSEHKGKHSHNKKYYLVVIKIKWTLKGKWGMLLIPPNGSQGIDCREELDCW